MRAGAGELPWEQAAVAAFKGQAPGVTLNLETVPNANEFDPKLTALLAGGTPPDVWTHWGLSGFGDYLARGLLADLSPFAARDKLDSSVFLPNTFDAWKRNGKLYGLSFNQRFGTFVYYNKQLFDGAGVPLPPVDWEDRSWTWDRMVEGARRITGGAGGAGQAFGVGAGAQPSLWGLAYQFGGDFFTKEHYANGVARTSNIGTPEVLAAMTVRVELMQRLRVWPTQADFQSVGISGLTPLFIAGRLGMLMDTGSEWPRIDKESKFEWGVRGAPSERQQEHQLHQPAPALRGEQEQGGRVGLHEVERLRAGAAPAGAEQLPAGAQGAGGRVAQGGHLQAEPPPTCARRWTGRRPTARSARISSSSTSARCAPRWRRGWRPPGAESARPRTACGRRRPASTPSWPDPTPRYGGK